MADGDATLKALVCAALLLCPSAASASEPYLPSDPASFQTWQTLYLDQRYLTSKWYEATMSEYEQCKPTPGPTFLNAYPRPSDGLYCYYWSIYQLNRSLVWMIVNAGLALQMLDCEWVDGAGALAVPRGMDLRCAAIQDDFGAFGR